MSQSLYDRERALVAGLAKMIRGIAMTTDFDHREYIGSLWNAGKPIHGDELEVSQGRLIYAIGRTLTPRNVYEIGIGPGITAHSLFSACPDMRYCGLDNLTGAEAAIPGAVRQTIANLHLRGSVQTIIADSDTVPEFAHPDGKIDLIHVDGDHGFEHQMRDVEKAIRSGAEWMLVDDCNDTEVVTACFAAWRNEWNKSWRGGLLPMIYFEDSRTGSFLFHTAMWAHL